LKEHLIPSPNNMSSSPIKNEFTEVLTGSDLLPRRPISVSSSDEFPTVITESSLLRPSIPNDSPVERENLIDLYDQTFASLDQYRSFTNTKLTPWTDTLEYKYFDNLYTYHRGTSSTIRNLRQQAEKLLEEADALSRRHYARRRELDDFISRLQPTPFQRRLLRPTKVYPRRIPPITERPRVTIRKPTFPVPSTSTIRPLLPPYPQVAPRSQIRCFQCNSTLHIKWHCSEYQCKSCKEFAPGHAYKNCPRHLVDFEGPFDDGTRGYFDIEGDDGNLNGEC
jgi:hypothetical protein